MDAFANPEEYARGYAPLFADQQFFDWAIVQSEALTRLREAGISPAAKTITFSATDSAADLVLNRGLLVSRLPNWPGPLLDLDRCLLRGPHNAENLLATLAVGHVLRIPLEDMVDSLKTYSAGSHRCQLVAEIQGVQFVDDSKASNLHAMEKAVQAARGGPNGEPNVWLIAGGADSGLDFHAAGPLLSQRAHF
jgi:UDP-N-acetylmuramoylalanine--D-glutamate ligase